MSEEILVELRSVSRQYKLGKTVVNALEGVSLEIVRSDFLIVAGPSGSGKSTLLNLIGCIDQPTAGSVIFDSTDVATLSDRELSAFRAHKLGFIFESFNLVPVLNAHENVDYPLRLRNVPAAERQSRTEAMLEAVGLQDQALHRPGELSGGQRQRVAIARALVTHPELVLADEPTANLDTRTGETIIDLMKEMRDRLGTTFVIATHDPMVAERARRRVEIRDGRISNDSLIPSPR
ncbi:MAG: ABC transporter ATP-binding protein [Verrucomicrobiales bacterium]|nr:ABC transporter ATP-binding protein [Verrucomicrobiales bacterium]